MAPRDGLDRTSQSAPVTRRLRASAGIPHNRPGDCQSNFISFKANYKSPQAQHGDTPSQGQPDRYTKERGIVVRPGTERHRYDLTGGPHNHNEEQAPKVLSIMPEHQQERRVSSHKERQDNIVFPEEGDQYDNHHYADDSQDLISPGFRFHFLAGKHLYEEWWTHRDSEQSTR